MMKSYFTKKQTEKPRMEAIPKEKAVKEMALFVMNWVFENASPKPENAEQIEKMTKQLEGYVREQLDRINTCVMRYEKVQKAYKPQRAQESFNEILEENGLKILSQKAYLDVILHYVPENRGYYITKREKPSSGRSRVKVS